MASIRSFTSLISLIVVACALTVSTYTVFGHTWDEPAHIAAGMALIDRGEYPYDQQHPTLARFAVAIGPYLAGAHSYGNIGYYGVDEGLDILYEDGRYDLYLTLARLGALPFLILLLIATWLWARHSFGARAAVLATAFAVTTPVLVGHAGLAALDLPLVGTGTMALYLLMRWLETPSRRGAVAFGFAFGVAASTKLSALPFIGISATIWIVAWWLAARSHSTTSDEVTGWRALLGHLLTGASLTVLVLCSAYAFHLSSLVDSFVALVKHNREGHLSFLLGEQSRTGWWYFYLVALATKSPLPLLLTSLAGGGWSIARAVREKRWSPAAPTLALVGIVLFASSFSRINIGVRHILLVYPLMAIMSAAFVVAMWERFDRKVVRGTIVALLVWQAAQMVEAHPDYLADFNLLAGAHPEEILVDSDLDWSQDFRRLKRELARRDIDDFHFAYRGTADMERENLSGCTLLSPHRRVTGWVAINFLAIAIGTEDGGYDWLEDHDPVVRVGKTIDLYYIEPGGAVGEPPGLPAATDPER